MAGVKLALHRLAGHAQGTAPVLILPRQAAQHGGLARAGLAHQPERLALFDAQIDVTQHVVQRAASAEAQVQ